MSRKKKKVRVIYIIAAIWLIWGAGFPLFGVLHFLLLIGASVAALAFVFKKIKQIDEKNAAQNGGQPQQAREVVNTEVGTGSANPYSSTYRYSYSGRQGGAGGAPGKNGQNAGEVPQVELSKREKRKLAKQAAKEAELQRARDAENRKTEEAKRAEEEKKKREEDKKKSEQTLVQKYKVKTRPRTGDATIDKMLDDEELAIAEMRRLDDAIEDEKVSAQIVHLEDVTTKIVDFVVTHPDKKNQVRRFFNYYLPTSIKLLNSYDRVDNTGISGMNIDGTKGQVEEMMDKALEAFDKQLDSLYADEALDVSTEVKVMENLLSQENVSDEIMSSQNG